jgi:hypothetical protein
MWTSASPWLIGPLWLATFIATIGLPVSLFLAVVAPAPWRDAWPYILAIYATMMFAPSLLISKSQPVMYLDDPVVPALNFMLPKRRIPGRHQGLLSCGAEKHRTWPRTQSV